MEKKHLNVKEIIQEYLVKTGLELGDGNGHFMCPCDSIICECQPGWNCGVSIERFREENRKKQAALIVQHQLSK